MWWLLGAMCFFYALGNVFCLFLERPKNPEADMNVSEIISYWGYPCEKYDVVTEDGYILSIHRIPYGKNDSNKLVPKPAVFLMHGLILSASIWLLNLPNSSLGFVLAEAGFDVWLGNSRGNTYARRHLHLDPDSKDFWTFSYDQQIEYDLKASIDFIVNKTGQKQIYYIGHSQGTLIAFGAFATNQELAQKVKINFALAPVATAKYLTGAVRIIAYVPPPIFKATFGEKDILSRSNNIKVVQTLCQKQVDGTICKNLMTLQYGYDPQNLNESRLDVYTGNLLEGTSVQNILHYAQNIRTGLFQAYDWGNRFQNIQHYNQPTPPLYRIEDMKVPTAIWYGGRDILADGIDIQSLKAKIFNLIHQKCIPHYNHMDFVFGLDVGKQIYDEIIAIIKKYESD